MKPDLCLYHSPCADGFTAAWAVWRRWGDGVEYVRCQYGKPPIDVDRVAGKHLLFVDFSYKKPVLEELGQSAASITILDHHVSAQRDLEEFAVLNPVSADDIDDVVAATQPGLGNIRAIFNMEKSGARLAWEHCFPSEPAPKLVQYVEDRDLWRFALPGSRAINAYIFAHSYNFEVWNDVAAAVALEPFSVAIAGDTVEMKHHKDLTELLEQTARKMTIGGVVIDVANLPYTFASDGAHALATLGSVGFAATYYDRADGKRVFSLRSTDGGPDVSEIAQRYGGGGHVHAAGFEAPRGWEGDASNG